MNDKGELFGAGSWTDSKFQWPTSCDAFCFQKLVDSSSISFTSSKLLLHRSSRDLAGKVSSVLSLRQTILHHMSELQQSPESLNCQESMCDSNIMFVWVQLVRVSITLELLWISKEGSDLAKAQAIPLIPHRDAGFCPSFSAGLVNMCAVLVPD